MPIHVRTISVYEPEAIIERRALIATAGSKTTVGTASVVETTLAPVLQPGFSSTPAELPPTIISPSTFQRALASQSRRLARRAKLLPKIQLAYAVPLGTPGRHERIMDLMKRFAKAGERPRGLPSAEEVVQAIEGYLSFTVEEAEDREGGEIFEEDPREFWEQEGEGEKVLDLVKIREVLVEMAERESC